MTRDVVARDSVRARARSQRGTKTEAEESDRETLTHDALTDRVFNELANQKRPGVLTRLRRRRQARKMNERMVALRAQAKADLGGKTYTQAEIDAAIKAAKGKAPI